MRKKITHIENNDKTKELTKKAIVNLITGIRTIGTFAIIPIYMKTGATTTALCSSAFFLTDMLDGALARSWHVQSFFGSLLDGLSDKAYAISCMALLAHANPIYLLPIGLELSILKINYSSMQRGNNVKSSILGKIKTGILALTMVDGFFLLQPEELKNILNNLNITSFDTLLNQKPSVLSNIAITPLIISELIVIGDYIAKSKKQDKAKLENKDISSIQKEKARLIETKETLAIQKLQLKSRQEIIHDLFDTEFYLTNKDGGIKKLLYKKV